MCTYSSFLDCMALSGLHFCPWNSSAPRTASHLYTWLAVVWGIQCYCCCLTPSKSQQWILYLAILGGYLLPASLHPIPNLLPVSLHLAYPCSFFPKYRLHISLKTSQSSSCKSIQHYQHYPMAASAWILPRYLQLLRPSTVVHLKAVTNISAHGKWMYAVSVATCHPYVFPLVEWSIVSMNHPLGKLPQGEYWLLWADWACFYSTAQVLQIIALIIFVISIVGIHLLWGHIRNPYDLCFRCFCWQSKSSHREANGVSPRWSRRRFSMRSRCSRW